jgi:ParB family transcriptional regulator, chromosome partitioning protein
MTAVIQDATADEASTGEAGERSVLDGEASATAIPGATGGGRPVIAVALLAAHPGNVRRDRALDEEFIASVRELGILTPLRVTPDGDGYRVIEGHRRLAAAIEVGLAEVPCDIAADRADDEAGQFLDMYATNHHRKDLTALEEADALFSASAAGASKTRIRKATGLGRDAVTAALAAGRLSENARDSVADAGYDLTLEQLALLAEFDGDDEAVIRLVDAFTRNGNGEYVAEAIRQKRRDAAAHAEIVAQLEADGFTVTDSMPDLGIRLDLLQHDGQPLTPETHTGCPGRGAFFYPYLPLDPVHYCDDPQSHDHQSRYQTPALSLGDDSSARSQNGPGDSPAGGTQPHQPDPTRRLVIEGNKAWTVSGTVRQRWLADKLFPRKSTPKETMPFIAVQLLTRPGPVRDNLGHATGYPVFIELTGSGYKPDEVATWPAARLPLALLAAIVTCYEEKLTAPLGKMTWRTDRPTEFSSCSREDTGAYFRFLASIGHELSPIEQAVADGVPYTGEQAGDDLDIDAEPTEDGGESSDASADVPASDPVSTSPDDLVPDTTA